jgi:hypothetical protein
MNGCKPLITITYPSIVEGAMNMVTYLVTAPLNPEPQSLNTNLQKDVDGFEQVFSKIRPRWNPNPSHRSRNIKTSNYFEIPSHIEEV